MVDEARLVFDFATDLFKELYERHFSNPKRVRRKICGEKLIAEDWLNVHETAHGGSETLQTRWSVPPSSRAAAGSIGTRHPWGDGRGHGGGPWWKAPAPEDRHFALCAGPGGTTPGGRRGRVLPRQM